MFKKVYVIGILILLAACGTNEKEAQANDTIQVQACSRSTIGYGYTTQGSDVRYAQEQLLARGNSTVKAHINNAGGADGYFGSGTYEAVKAYQRQVNDLLRRFGEPTITVNGIIDDATWPWLGCGSTSGGGNGSVSFPSGLSLPIATGQADGYHQTYWDANANHASHPSDNPLLDTRNKTSSKVSTNFTVRELSSSGGVQFEFARIDPDLVSCLQGIRSSTGRAVNINSGYRSWAHNVKIYEDRGRTPTLSRHTSGQAADITISGYSGLDIAKKAVDQCGCNIGVGIANSYAHIDVRGYWASWQYPSGSSLKNSINSYRNGKCN